MTDLGQSVDGGAYCAVAGLVIEPTRELVRCVRLAATGELAYEFSLPGGKKTFRVLADAYDTALAHVRMNPIEEADLDG